VLIEATHLIWQAAGSPPPRDADGQALATFPPRVCARCGDPGGVHRYVDCVSDTFIQVTNASRLFPHDDGGEVRLCPACAFCVKDGRLRGAAFFATATGMIHVPRKELLARLLDPPESPFVALFGKFGAEHGGEKRDWSDSWSTASRITPPKRLQSKVGAIYAVTALSRVRYPLQVDGAQYVVDVPRWTVCRDVALSLVTDLAAGHCGSKEIRAALLRLRLPPRKPWHTAAFDRLVPTWRSRIASLRPHADAPWWALFVGLLPVPTKDASEPNTKDDDEDGNES
jgi:hypothetical protein